MRYERSQVLTYNYEDLFDLGLTLAVPSLKTNVGTDRCYDGYC